jgi:hypothetical protein
LENDSYQTPPEAIGSLLAHVKPQGRFLEPCAGSGNILAAVRAIEPALAISWCELYPSDGGPGVDFLAHRVGGPGSRYDWIVTNPPYSQACGFIEQSLRLASNVAMLLRLNFLESEERREWWQRRLPSALYVLARRPGFRDRGGKRVVGKNGKPGTDACAYGWFVWSQKYSGIHVIG